MNSAGSAPQRRPPTRAEHRLRRSALGLAGIALAVAAGWVGLGMARDYRPFYTPNPKPPIHRSTPVTGYRLFSSHPHGRDAFTQGLVVTQGKLYESTGLHRHSTLRRIDWRSGKVEQVHRLDDALFGEGLTVWNGTLVQGTWHGRRLFSYRPDDLSLIQTRELPWMVWGLTADDRHLILSDGSATLRFLDPDTLSPERAITVRDGAAPITNLNELEFIAGEVFANVWKTDYIARIDPATGAVLSWIDLTDLRGFESLRRNGNVLNGIAYDTQSGALLVTGKRWDRLFAIAVDSAPMSEPALLGFEER